MNALVTHPTIAELLLTRAEDDSTGLLFEDSVWTWREVIREAATRSGALSEVRPDDAPWHIGVLMENVPEYLFLIAGAALCGATVVGINPTRRGDELAGDIRGADCSVIITDSEHAHLLDGLDHAAASVWLCDSASYADLLTRHRDAAAEPTEAALDPTTQLLLLFTSGSTGAPKAVICSTGRWAMVCQLNPIAFTSDDVAYNAMPLFHGNALMGAWGPCLVSGATFAMRRRFSASGFGPDIRRFGATFFNYVGRSLAYVLAQPESADETDNKLRFGFGTEASAHDRAEFLRRYGCEVFESYGSSEGTCYIVRTPETPDGALGVPQVGFEIDIVSEDGSVAPTAQLDANGVLTNPAEAIGEIVSRGAAARFEGYYKNEAAAADKIRGGDFYTGDLGYRDADGFFWFAGRTADWIRVDSENFATAPVERILARLPGAAVVAVYPVPDSQTGDQVMAAIQMSGRSFDPDEFASFLVAQPDLGTKWAPRFVRVTEDLPVTATRKVDKPALRRQLWVDGSDVVWERRGDRYVAVDADRQQSLRDEFAQHQRTVLLG